MNNDPLKQLWQSQPAATAVFSEPELARRARRLQRGIGRRNLRETLAGLLVIAGFAYYLWKFPFPLMRLGSALLILGVLVLLWQLQRRASRQLPPEAAGLSCRDFHRAALLRQRDALRSVWLWYIGPMLPGIVVFRWGVKTELDASAPFAQGTGADLLIGAVLLAVVYLNRRAAKRLQAEVDVLDRLEPPAPPPT